MMNRARQLKRTFAATIALAVAFGVFAQSFGAYAASSITKQFNYQARITSAAGIPVPDGSLSVKLEIWDASSGGTCKYTAQGTCGTPTAKTVTVTNGVFSTVIGEAGDNAIPDNLFDTNDLWLGITVGADAEMTPRKAFSAAPYAFNADRLDDLDASAVGGITAFVPVTDSSGLITITGDPTGSTAVITANPASGQIATNDLLFALRNNSSDRFTVDAEGDTVDNGSFTLKDLSPTPSGVIFRVTNANSSVPYFTVSSTSTLLAAGEKFAIGNIAPTALATIQDSTTNLGTNLLEVLNNISGTLNNRAFTVSATSTQVPGNTFIVGATNTLSINSSGNFTLINNVTTRFPAAQGANNSVLKNDGAGNLTWSAANSLSNLENDYNNSTSTAEITLNSTRGGLTLQDTLGATGIGQNLFEVLNNNPTTLNQRAFTVSATSTQVPGNIFIVGATNTLQIDSSGNFNIINGITARFPSAQGANNSVLKNDGAGNLTWTAANSLTNLENAYNNSTSTNEITLNTTKGSLTLIDTLGSVGLGTNLFEVLNNIPGTLNNRAFTVSATSTQVPGNLFIVGATNTLQIDSSGNFNIVNGITARFPSSQGALASVLRNDGVGNLTWVAGSSLTTLNQAYNNATGTPQITINSTQGPLAIANTVGGTATSLLALTGTFNNVNLGNFAGLNSLVTVAPGSQANSSGSYNSVLGTITTSGSQDLNFSGIIGGSFSAQTAGSVTNAVLQSVKGVAMQGTSAASPTAIGGSFSAGNGGTGTLNSAIGVDITNQVSSTGLVANMYGVRVRTPNTNANSVINNLYGVYIESQTKGDTLNYALYAAYGQSYLNGDVEIGTTSALARLTVAASDTSMTKPIFEVTNSAATVPYLTVSTTSTLINQSAGASYKFGLNAISPTALFTIQDGNANVGTNLLEILDKNALGSWTKRLFAVSATNTQINGMTYVFPTSQSGTQVLQNDGGGNLTWATVSGGSTNLEQAYNNSTTTNEITLNATKGPVTIKANAGNGAAMLELSGSINDPTPSQNLTGLDVALTTTYNSTYTPPGFVGISSIITLQGAGSVGNNVVRGATLQALTAGSLVGGALNGAVVSAFQTVNSSAQSITGQQILYGNTGTVNYATSAFGLKVQPYALSTGHVSSVYDIYVQSPNMGTNGVINNVYGLYIENQSMGDTLNYAVYSAGGRSFFAGNFGIGNSTPNGRLIVSASDTNDGNVLIAAGNFNDSLRFLTVSSTSTLMNSAGTSGYKVAYGMSNPTALYTIQDTRTNAGTNLFEILNSNVVGSYTGRLLSVSTTSTLVNADALSGYKFGIGTKAPTAVLDVADSSNSPTNNIFHVTNANESINYLTVNSTSTIMNGAGVTGYKVAYGTLAPSALYTVQDTKTAAGTNLFEVLTNNGAGAYTRRLFYVSATGTSVSLENAYNSSTSTVELTLNSTIGPLTIKDTIGSMKQNLMEILNSNALGAATMSPLTVSTTATLFNPTAASGFKVGIGRSSPNALFALQDSNTVSASNLLEILNNTQSNGTYTTRLLSVSATSTLFNTGNITGYNVGIGTATPGTRLNIFDNAVTGVDEIFRISNSTDTVRMAAISATTTRFNALTSTNTISNWLNISATSTQLNGGMVVSATSTTYPVTGYTMNLGGTALGNTFIMRIPQKTLSANCNVAVAEGLIFEAFSGSSTRQVGHMCVSGGGATQASKLIFFAQTFQTGSSDLAEEYGSFDEDLAQPGDLVAVSATGTNNVGRSRKPYQPDLMGIISTEPGVALSDAKEDGSVTPLKNGKFVALAGRVPTKVTGENGIIKPGDPITSSSTVGYGMKATRAGRVVGISLTSFDPATASATSTITVFVGATWYNGPDAASGQTVGSALTVGDHSILDYKGSTITNLGSIVSASGAWSVTPDGFLTIKHIDAEEVATKKLTIKSDQTDPTKQTVGQSLLKSGYNKVLVQNPNIHANSLIIVTFSANPGSAWWIGEKTEGQFSVDTAAFAPGDAPFTWWIVGVDASVDPTASGSSTPPTDTGDPTDSGSSTDPTGSASGTDTTP